MVDFLATLLKNITDLLQKALFSKMVKNRLTKNSSGSQGIKIF
jgi:hypothetical protein